MMTQRLRRAAFLILVTGPLSLTIAACDGAAGRADSGDDAAVRGSQEEGDNAATDAGPKRISINNFKYEPATLTVPVGTKVVWTNRDDMPHTVTSTGEPKTLDSTALDTDEEFSFVFDNAGTFDYFCTVHPKMTGQVIVK
jgi:plastocyanin